MDRHRTLMGLIETHQIDLRPGPILDKAPRALPAGSDFGRVEGMLLGLAVGDSLGNTTESMLPGERFAQHGEIRAYLPHRHAGGRRVGLPSDDTQMAFWTLEQTLEDDGLEPEHLADRFCRRQIFGIGQSVKGFIANRKAGLPWYACGVRSAGNGALMRIAPVLIPHLRSATPALWADAALAAMVTHNDGGSTAACVAFVSVLWRLLQMDHAPEPEWWLESYVEVARQLEPDKAYQPRGGAYADFRGPLWRLVAEKVPEAHRRGLSVKEAGSLWYSGAYLLETLPSVIYILMRHGDDPEEAIVRAVNDTKDNDTIAAIVGAAVGALHGRSALSQAWLDGLLGRLSADDDGHAFRLIEAARQRWWSR